MRLDPSQHHDPLTSPEELLLTAVLTRAFLDVRSVNAQIQGDAAQWFATGTCAWLCAALDLDVQRTQQRARAMARAQVTFSSQGRSPYADL